MTAQLDPARNAMRRLNSSKCVFVSCKLPHGLLLEVGKIGDDRYEWIRLKGTRTDSMQRAAVTQVPEDFWNTWLKGSRKDEVPGHEWMVAVRNKQIEAHESEAHAQAAAFGKLQLLTGLEPLKGPDVTKPGEREIEVDNEHLRKLGVA